MRIIATKTLRLYFETHPESKQALGEWYVSTKRSVWGGIEDVMKDCRYEVTDDGIIVFLLRDGYRVETRVCFEPKLVCIERVEYGTGPSMTV